MTQPEQYAHQPVLLEEVLELLPTRTDGFYVDGTFGRGGHSRALLQRLDERGLLVGIDRDPQAVAAGEELAGSDARFRIRAGRFDCLEQVVAEVGRPLDGVLLDLGVSSPQLDDPARGFSFMRDGPLDMRMDPTSGESAAQWLARADEKDIADVLYRYGEEKRSRAIARRIVEQRRQQPVATTAELAALIESVLGRGVPGKHPATRSFQAIRMHVNQEMAALEAVLDQALRCLAPGGRLLVISFHSLEDRLVKLFMRDAAGRTPQPRGLPVPPQPVLMRVLGKARQASDAEVAGNARARSAVLRAAEKVAA